MRRNRWDPESAGSSNWTFVSQDTVLTPDQSWYVASSVPLVVSVSDSYGSRPYQGSFYTVVLRGEARLKILPSQTVLLHDRSLSSCVLAPAPVCTLEMVCVSLNNRPVVLDIFCVFGNFSVQELKL